MKPEEIIKFIAEKGKGILSGIRDIAFGVPYLNLEDAWERLKATWFGLLAIWLILFGLYKEAFKLLLSHEIDSAAYAVFFGVIAYVTIYCIIASICLFVFKLNERSSYVTSTVAMIFSLYTALAFLIFECSVNAFGFLAMLLISIFVPPIIAVKTLKSSLPERSDRLKLTLSLVIAGIVCFAAGTNAIADGVQAVEKYNANQGQKTNEKSENNSPESRSS